VSDLAECIGGQFHLLAKLHNREITLSHGVKILAQEDGMRGLVGLELVGVCDTKLLCSLILGHEVKNRLGDGAVEPRAEAIVHLFPSGITAARRNSVVDVVKMPELATHCLEEGRPLVVVGVRQIQCYGDVRIDKDRGEGVEEEGVG